MDWHLFACKTYCRSQWRDGTSSAVVSLFPQMKSNGTWSYLSIDTMSSTGRPSNLERRSIWFCPPCPFFNTRSKYFSFIAASCYLFFSFLFFSCDLTPTFTHLDGSGSRVTWDCRHQKIYSPSIIQERERKDPIICCWSIKILWNSVSKGLFSCPILFGKFPFVHFISRFALLT